MENRDFNIPYIEDPSDLGLKIDELSFVDIDNIEVIEDFKGSVYDLEIDNLHNYQTELGIVHNGGGRRKGSISVYLEPWHADIFPFLDLRKNNGKEELRARDLFLALWIPDLFMKRVKDNGTWTLMCPHECPGLAEVYGQDFEDLYTKYETEGKGRITVKAQDLWFKILESQYETGTPYILFKDACNSKSNQKHLGTIKGSNLCLTGDSLVLSKINGIEREVEIEIIVDLFKSGNKVEVLSYNEITKTNEWKEITNAALMNANAEVIKIYDEESNKTITCTPEHLIYTQNRGYVMAKDLIETDILNTITFSIF